MPVRGTPYEEDPLPVCSPTLIEAIGRSDAQIKCGLRHK